MTGPDVITVGDLFVDHIFTGFAAWPRPGEEIFAQDYARELGGGAANTACGLARLGRQVETVGFIGNAERRWATGRLEEMGVSGDGLIAVDDSSGITVSLSMRDERSFFSHAGANRWLAAWLDQPASVDRLATARHVHFALPITASCAANLFPRLHAAGSTISLDIGHMPDWLGDPANQATLAGADYFLPNAAEAVLMGALSPIADGYPALARRVGMQKAVVKLGSDGAVFAGRDESIHVPPPPVDALDTTGAGDAFDAGFIDALLDGSSPRDLLRRACIVGALSTRRAGALAALPDKTELWRTYEQYYGG